MPVNNDQILIDDDGGIAPIFQEVRLQRAELLLAQRREQLGHLRQHNRGALRAAVNDPSVLHQAASHSPWFCSAAVASSARRGERSSTSVALIRKPGWRVGSSEKVMVSKSPEAASLQPFQA